MSDLIQWAKDVLDGFIVNPTGGASIWAAVIALALAVRFGRSIFVGLVRALLGR